MVQISIPFSVSYQTEGITPVSDVIAALKATDAIMQDAVSLLPSLIRGLTVQECSLNVRRISQESPLREIFAVALFLAFQDDLEAEVPPLLENLLGITVSDKYDTLVTVAFLAVVFYSISFAKDAALKVVGDHVLAKKLDELIGVIASQTGQSRDDVRAILDSKFSKPSLVKKWISDSIDFFRPSKNAGNVPILVGGSEIDRETVMAVTEAEAKGWRYQKPGNSAHIWGRLYCPLADRDGCRVSVNSTPRVPENQASKILKATNACQHNEGGQDENL